VIPERQAVPLPEGVSPELGASLGVPAMTAYWCLYAPAKTHRYVKTATWIPCGPGGVAA
jgi:NADPH:quinone reductase-like Zn-dependent oxidoreductase